MATMGTMAAMIHHRVSLLLNLFVAVLFRILAALLLLRLPLSLVLLCVIISSSSSSPLLLLVNLLCFKDRAIEAVADDQLRLVWGR